MKDRSYQVLGVILGIGMFLGGLVMLTDDEVTCGNRVMEPGDTCKTIKGGSVTERSYDEQKSADNRIYIAGMVIGPILAIGSLVVFGGGGGRRRPRMPQRPGDPQIPPMFRRRPHTISLDAMHRLNDAAMSRGYPPPYPEVLPQAQPPLQQHQPYQPPQQPYPQPPPQGPAYGGPPPHPPYGSQPPPQPPYPPQPPGPYGY